MVFAACALAIAAPAVAQWAWKDDSGRMVYSDRPPPASIRQSQITRSPTVVTAPAPAAPAGTAPGASGAPAEPGAAAPNPAPDAAAKPGPKSLADQEADFRKRLQARATAEKKAADDDAKAAKEAQDCDRVKGYIHSLESGMRINRVGADGNPHFLDDSERAVELDRARANAASVCR